MKFNNETAKSFINTITTAHKAGVDILIFEETSVRGMDEGQKVILLSKTPAPLFDDTMCIPDVSNLFNRINTVMSVGDVAITGTADAGHFKSLKIKSGKLAVDYRCGNPKFFRLPRGVRETFVYEMTLDKEAQDLLLRGQSIMGSESVTLIGDHSGVKFEIADVNNDKFTHTVADQITKLDETAPDAFSYSYYAKVLIPLLKSNEINTFTISGGRGMIELKLGDINLYVLPRIV